MCYSKQAPITVESADPSRLIWCRSDGAGDSLTAFSLADGSAIPRGLTLRHWILYICVGDG